MCTHAIDDTDNQRLLRQLGMCCSHIKQQEGGEEAFLKEPGSLRRGGPARDCMQKMQYLTGESR